MSTSRREFVKSTSLIALGGVLPGFSAKSYASIMGANERIKVSVMGVHSRGLSLATNFASQKNCEVLSICDVDSNSLQNAVGMVTKVQNSQPKSITDFKRALEDKSLDAMVIATPDHWHAPAAILACKAGKHVYVEKPCSHNPHEGELLVAAAKKYNRQVQMGSQRRSWPNQIEAIKELRAGVIGRPYFAKGWYTNDRPSIGIGKKTTPPSWLDYDLWQGPAPREPYRDNILHYNWHWFWNWGTGEALNNGTHMVDLMRWGLDVDYPISVQSNGGRYRYKDDWQTPDTQVISWEFSNNTLMQWEGRSCSNFPVEGSNVGVIFYGETGTLEMEVAGGNSYRIYDSKNKLLKEAKNDTVVDTTSKVAPSTNLDGLHIQNFFDGIRKNDKLNADILTGHKSTLLVQLGNISQRMGKVALKIDPSNGRIIGNEAAMKYWTRQYEPGWAPSL